MEDSVRFTFKDLFNRWIGMMDYANHKVNDVDIRLLRKYCKIYGNIALDFGRINQGVNSPEIPDEVVASLIREFEQLLVFHSMKLKEFETLEADFRKSDESKKSVEVKSDADDVKEEVDGSSEVTADSGEKKKSVKKDKESKK